MTTTTSAAPAAPTTSRTWIPFAAGAVTLVLWASAFVAIRHLGEAVEPGALSLGRLLVAAVALGVLVFRRRPTWPTGRRDWSLVAICGAAWFGIYNLALNASEQRIDAGTAALIVQIGPLLIALLATVFLGEKLTRWLLIGMVVGFAGVALISQGSSGSSADLLGVGLAIVAAVTYAIGVLAQKPLLGRLPGLEVTWLACLVGVVVCLPWSGDLVYVVRTGSTSDLLWIAYLGIFPTAIAFLTWAYALARTDAGKLSLTTFLVPFIATLLAWLLLDEIPPALAFAGGALCIAGVLLTRIKPRPASL